MKKQILVATNNQHKVEEFRAIFAGDEWEFITLEEAGVTSDPKETGATFKENAQIKAHAAWEACSKKMPVVADDSGLEVDLLNGEPGVYSSRYAGENATDEENNTKLLERLGNAPDILRAANFKCVLVYIDEEGNEAVAKGYCAGAIGHTPQGENGFGYDPLFWPSDYPEMTMAQLSPAEKNRISHRGMAVRKLREYLHGGSEALNAF